MLMKILKIKISLLLAIAILIASLHVQSKHIEIKNLTEKLQTYEKVVGIPLDNITSVKVTVTSYNPTRRQCDKTPLYGNDGELVTPGIVAISSDLRKKYGLKNGDIVMLEGLGSFTVKDAMHPRWSKRVDIISFIPQFSKKFGAKEGVLMYFSSSN